MRNRLFAGSALAVILATLPLSIAGLCLPGPALAQAEPDDLRYRNYHYGGILPSGEYGHVDGIYDVEENNDVPASPGPAAGPAQDSNMLEGLGEGGIGTGAGSGSPMLQQFGN